MSGFDEQGFHKPGTIGCAHHLGPPLTAGQIRDLPDGAEIVVTWSGGDGPWPYRVLADTTGQRRVESTYPDPLLPYDFPDRGDLQRIPLCRVTAGWNEETRAWADQKTPEPEHIRAEWRRLRGAGPP